MTTFIDGGGGREGGEGGREGEGEREGGRGEREGGRGGGEGEREGREGGREGGRREVKTVQSLFLAKCPPRVTTLVVFHGSLLHVGQNSTFQQPLINAYMYCAIHTHELS